MPLFYCIVRNVKKNLQAQYTFNVCIHKFIQKFCENNYLDKRVDIILVNLVRLIFKSKENLMSVRLYIIGLTPLI